MISFLLEQAAHKDPSKVAIVYGDERISYGELLQRANQCAAGLRNQGVGEGDYIAMVLPNCPEFIVTFFATVALNAIVLPLNPQYKTEELNRFLADAKPRVIVSRGPIEIVNVDHNSEAYSGQALYLYTSGSTDTYKRVCCTQENLYWEARNFVETAGLTAADTILCTIPLFHSYGIGNCLLDAVYLGATLVLLPPEPDAEGPDPPFANRCHQVAELFRKEKISFYPGVPYQFAVLASLPANFLIDLSSARLFVSSGDFLPAATFARFQARFGKPIRSLYGSTEAGSIAIDMEPDTQIEYGSVGMPVRNVAIEIREGDVWVKSPTIPPSTAFADGFYNTGDTGHLNHRGQLILDGRKQSFINLLGYKVDTSEVELVLEACPGVREAAVLGVEVPRMGTLVKAVIVAEGACTESDIRAFCRQKLAFYKVPRLIEFHAALPRSAVGKVLKSELGGVEQYLNQIRNGETTRIAAQLQTAPPARRRALVASLVNAQAAAVLARSIETIPRDTGFTELGMDSFASIELQGRLEYLFDLELPQTFTFDHPTIDAVTDYLMEPTQ